MATVLVDESVPRAVLRVFLAHGHDAKRVQDLGPRGITNHAVLRLATGTGWILVTRDADFLKLRAVEAPQCKIVYLQAYADEPEKLASHVDAFMERCFELLARCEVVMVTAAGAECVAIQA